MRKYLSIMILAALVMLVGCGGTAATEALSQDDEQLSNSMRRYFDTDDKGYASGGMFTAKILDCTKIKYTDPEYGEESIYKYEIAIAPRLNQPMDKIQVKVFPTSGIYEHFEGLAKMGDRSINLKQGFILEYPAMGITHKSELRAFRYSFYMSNFGDKVMGQAGISDEDLDSGMTNLRVEIFCDGKTDVLELSYGSELYTIEKPEDERALTDSALYELVTQGRTEITFSEF